MLRWKSRSREGFSHLRTQIKAAFTDISRQRTTAIAASIALGLSVLTPLPASAAACSPTISTSSTSTIVQFKSTGSCTWTVPAGVVEVDFLVIAGGGGGSNYGGGGAGGYRTSYGTSGGGSSAESKLTLTPGSSISITVGSGGSGGTTAPTNGLDSKIGTLVTSTGGGAAGYYSSASSSGSGNTGGSGGGSGAAGLNETNRTLYGSGTANQGYRGGISIGEGGGGGGGAGSVGYTATTVSVGANGGNGVSSSITGSSVTRGGGGAGGGYSANGGTGGSGGGGNGGLGGTGATAGSANTGGGGGAAGRSTVSGADGGSGIVVIRYLTPVSLTLKSNYTGGAADRVILQQPGSLTIPSNNFTRTGYTFAGWNTNSGGTGTSYSDLQTISLTTNSTLYAKWEPDQSLTFKAGANGSGSDQVETKYYNSDYTMPNLATASSWFSKPGYKIVGWSTEDDNTTDLAFGATYSSNSAATFYAVYESSLVLNIDATDTNSYTSGTAITNLGTHSGNASITTRSGSLSQIEVANQTWDFPAGNDGAYIDIDGAMAASQFSLGMTIDTYAALPEDVDDSHYWDRILDFGDANDGEWADGTSNLILTRSARTNDLSVRLYSGASLPTSAICNAANVFDGTLKRITVALDGASCQIWVDGAQVTNDAMVTALPDAAAEWDNMYIGRSNNSTHDWQQGAIRSVRIFSEPLTPAEIDSMYSGDLTYKTVSLDGNGGTVSGNSTASLVTTGSISLPAPTKAKLAFAGWYSDSALTTFVGQAGDSFTPTANTDLYAKWSSLIVDLDASNNASYPGSGSTWTNLVNGDEYTIAYGSFDSGNGGSIVFNGSGTTVPLGQPLETGTDYSVEAWVYDDTGATGSRNIVSSRNTPLFLSNSTLNAGVAGTYSRVSSTSFPQGVWKHVAVTFSDANNRMRLYIDGAQVSENTGVTDQYASELMYVGAHVLSDGNNTSWWKGKIASVKIYSVERTSSQIASTFSALAANYDLGTYNVLYDEKGGSTVADGTFQIGGAVTFPSDPTRAGYTFGGWSASNVGLPVSTPYTPGVLQDINLYAIWVANTNTVSWDSNGGSSVSSSTFETGSSISKPSDPTRAGYRFEGWSTSETSNQGDLANKISSWPYSSGATTDITLYAIWLQESSINFAGSSPAGAKTSGANLIPMNSSYTWEAWVKPSTLPGTGTRYATIMDNIEAGNNYGRSWMYVMDTGSGPYLSSGYWTESQKGNGFGSAAGSITYNSWNHVAVSYERTGSAEGDCNGSGTLIAKLYINGVLANDPGVTVNSFSGCLNNDELGVGYNIDDNFQQFPGQIDQVKIWSGVLTESEIQNSMQSYQLGTVDNSMIAHYDFNQLSSNPAYGDTVPNRAATGSAYDLSLFANTQSFVDSQVTKTANLFTVAFNGNSSTSGSVAPVSNLMPYDSFSIPSPGNLQRTGFLFDGWNSASNGTGTSYSAGDPYLSLYGDTTLYAQWVTNVYTITYTYNGATGGNATSSADYEIGGSALTLPTPTKTSMLFGGWYSDSSLTNFVGYAGGSYTPSADGSLYARWTNLLVNLEGDNSDSLANNGTTWTSVLPGSSNVTGTATGATYFSSGSIEGFSFDGTGDAVRFPAGTGGISGDITVEAWIQPSTIRAGWNLLASKWFNNASGGGGSQEWHFAIRQETGQQARLNLFTSNDGTSYAGNNLYGDFAFESGKWYQVGFTLKASGEVQFFVNGQADGSAKTGALRTARPGSELWLGDARSSAYSFIGNMSEFRLYNKALSTSEILASFKNDSAKFGQSLITYKAGDNSSGSDLVATKYDGAAVSIGNSVTSNNYFTRTGYVIIGWNTASDGTSGTDVALGASYSTNADLTLYPVWGGTTVQVTFNANDGSGTPATATQNVSNGTATNLTANAFTRDGYTFAGWNTASNGTGTSYTDEDSVTLSTATTLYAQWTGNVYTVTYNYHSATGGNTTASADYTVGGSDLTLPTPTKTGYTFAGWYSEDSYENNVGAGGAPYAPTAAITLHAKWTAATYTITYDYNNATGGNTANSGSFTTGGTVLVLPVPTKAGYTFAGWYEASDFSGTKLGLTLTTTSSKTIYAKWTAGTYTVLYNYNGATGGDTTVSDDYTTGSTEITLPTPTKTGYTFSGWHESSSFAGSAATSPYTTELNRTIYAKWTAIEYSVTYHEDIVVSGNTISPDGGTAPTDTNQYTIGQSFAVAANSGSLYRNGFTFVGWVTSEDGTGTAKNSGETLTFGAADIDLYPKWQANTYTISYNLNGGSGDLSAAPASWTVGEANVDLPQAGLSKTGYTFAGWARTQGGSAVAYSFSYVGNVTLYALWTIKSINYSFDLGTATGNTIAGWPSNSAANFASTITLPDLAGTTTIIGGGTYQFFGWSYNTTTYNSGDAFVLGEDEPTFTAEWVQLFDVRYGFGGGTHSVSGDGDSACITGGLCVDGQNITLRSEPTRTGYTFGGWKVQDTAFTKDAGSSHLVSATQYLFYATWTAIDYDFSFNSMGGSSNPIPATKNIGQTLSMPNPGSKTGYTFAGWSADGGTTKYSIGSTYTVGSASKAFVAYWTPNVYTVVYDWQGASGARTPDASYTVGSGNLALPALGDHTKDGYEFAGWSETSGGGALTSFIPTANDVLYAVWIDGNYTLSYDAQGGNAAGGNGTVARGSSTTLPTPVRAGFRFQGWYDNTNAGSKIGDGGASYTPGRSKALYARWVQNSLAGVDLATLESASTYTASANTAVDTTINHVPTGTSARVKIPAGALPNGTSVSVQYFRDTTRQQEVISDQNSYIFSVLVSWLSGSGTSATVPSTASGKPIEVTLNNDSIKAGAMVYMVIGDEVTELGRAEVDGTVTVELTDDPEIVVAATVPDAPTSASATAGDAKATVSWTAPSNGGSEILNYTVTASPGGATCTTTATSCEVTGLTNGTAYTFRVTSTNAVGTSAQSSASTAITPALASFTVTYNSNGGSSVAAGNFISGGSISAAPTAPTRSGYTFGGWSTTLDDAATVITFPYTPGVTQNITLYALWTAVSSSDSGSYGGSSPAPNTPSDIGYTPQLPAIPVSQTGAVGEISGSSEKVSITGNELTNQVVAEAQGFKIAFSAQSATGSAFEIQGTGLKLDFASKTNITGEGLKANTVVEAWVFSEPIYLGQIQVDSQGKFTTQLKFPVTLKPGVHTLQIGTLTGANRLVKLSVPVTIEGKVNAGSFKGYVSVYAKGYQNHKLSAKIGKDWLIVPSLKSRYQRIVEKTGAGYSIRVRIYIDGVYQTTIPLKTR